MFQHIAKFIFQEIALQRRNNSADCTYDLVLVTEFAVVLHEADLRAPPAPLT